MVPIINDIYVVMLPLLLLVVKYWQIISLYCCWCYSYHTTYNVIGQDPNHDTYFNLIDILKEK
jgi:hypothetical protein